MAGKFNFPFFDQAQAGSKPAPPPPAVMPNTNAGTLQSGDQQGVAPVAQPLQHLNPDGGTFGLGSSV